MNIRKLRQKKIIPPALWVGVMLWDSTIHARFIYSVCVIRKHQTGIVAPWQNPPRDTSSLLTDIKLSRSSHEIQTAVPDRHNTDEWKSHSIQQSLTGPECWVYNTYRQWGDCFFSLLSSCNFLINMSLSSVTVRHNSICYLNNQQPGIIMGQFSFSYFSMTCITCILTYLHKRCISIREYSNLMNNDK